MSAEKALQRICRGLRGEGCLKEDNFVFPNERSLIPPGKLMIFVTKEG